MNVKEVLIGLAVTVIGGVAVYWFTTGYQAERHREEQRQEALRREDAERRRLAQTEEQRGRQETEARARAPRMSALEMNFNRNGFDYKDFVAANVDECLRACANEPQCKAITFTKSSRQCWMKSKVPLRENSDLYISAVKVGGT